MGRVVTSLRRRTGIWVFIAGIALALLLPVVASAANTATFSSATPKSKSWSTAKSPTISVVVYDRYGAKTSGVTMTLDGNKVSPTITYIVTGSWNPKKPDRRKFKLRYAVPTPLHVGTHTITVKVRDLKKRTSTYTWKFTIESTDPPATFDTFSPAKDSSSSSPRPLVSVDTYDPYGVKGTGSYKMAIDGTTVRPSMKYAKSGDYRDFKLSYQMPADLSPGTHTVKVSVEDLHGHDSSTSWGFTVLEPDPVYDPMPVVGTACTDCHAGYPAAHPANHCQLCHGPGRPVGGAYTPADQSAHTLSCQLEPCHGGGGTFPHVVSSDCVSCHNASRPDIPAVHSGPLDGYHVSTSTFCTQKGCHVASLTTEHYRHTVDGVRLSCESCHSSTDPAVVAAIDDGSTACDSCHEFGTDPHPGTAAAHAAVGSCVRIGCHSAGVAATHKGDCLACHGPGQTASTTCATCHAPNAYHADAAAAHAVPTGGCIGIAPGCHGTPSGGDASLVHNGNCSPCHTGSGTPIKTCATCHTTTTLALHPKHTAQHTAAAISCTDAECHGTDVTAIHVVDGSPRCTACHSGSKTPSAVCADCHEGDVNTVHASAAAAHVASGSTCITADCHPDSNVMVIHDTRTGGPGCVCHGAGKKPTIECSTCHDGTLPQVHAAAGANHTAPAISCVSENCHVIDVTEIHRDKTDGTYECFACHKDGATPTALCTACHEGSVLQLHAVASPSHAVPQDMCRTACHATDVAEIHDGTPSQCAACHSNSPRQPSTKCTDCHAGTVATYHASAAVFHTAPAGTCVLAGCHGGDMIGLHKNTTGQGCPACHAVGKNPSSTCATCHSGDVLTVHASADATHAAPVGISCVASVCHESNAAAIHNHDGGPGCIACHDPLKTPSTDCSTCHPGAIETIHIKMGDKHAVAVPGCTVAGCHPGGNDAAALHQNAPLSCTTCHTASSQPTTVCATCHVPNQILTIHASAEASHTAPTGTCVQADCHGGNVAVLHQSGPGCGACHNSGSTTATVECSTAGCHSGDPNIAHAGASVFHLARAGYCVRSGCHGGDLTSIHDANGTGPKCKACHGLGKTPSSTCTDCHPATQAAVHAASDTSHTVTQGTCAGYDLDSPCHHNRVDSVHRTAPDGCLSCHAAGKTPVVTCATCHVDSMTPVHASADTSHSAPVSLCVNSQCHDVDVSAIHADSTKTCLACHGPAATPSLTCANCHTDGVFVVHTHGDSAHAAPAISCVTSKCHGSDVRTLHSASGGPGCAACHGPNVTASLVCTDCHTTGFATLHARGNTSHTAPAGSCIRAYCHAGDVVALHADGPDCSACHAAGKTPSLVCANCHNPSSVAVHTPYVGTGHDTASPNCNAAGCHPASAAAIHSVPGGPSCRPCHTDGPLTVTCATAGCHAGDVTTYTAHAAQDTTHTAPTGSCVKSGCHQSNVSRIHTTTTGGVTSYNCGACHTGGETTLVCATCHTSSFTPAHPAPAAKHTAPTGKCVKSGCHGSNVATLHNDSPLQCLACHGENRTPSLDCATCHGSGGFPPNHPAPEAKHAITNNSCVSTTCHATANGATIHDASPSKCDACHGPGKTPSLVCATCHTGSVQVIHAIANGVHGVGNGCTGGSCHATDVSVIHVKSSVNHCEACHATNKTPSTNCATCHGATADHTSSHSDCNGCHYSLEHGSGPTIGVSDCYSCHAQGGSWVHPGLDCHGCQDPSNQTWYGLW